MGYTKPHWATELQPGDRVTATIRHELDGLQNRFNVPVIVVELLHNSIKASDNGTIVDIPFNELNQPTKQKQ